MTDVPVTVDNFDRAESHHYFKRYADLGAFGTFFHIRRPTPVDKQDVIRMNRDTLYSLAILDLTSPVTVVKPDPGGRYQSLMAVSEDHSIFPAEHDGGEVTFTQEGLREPRSAGTHGAARTWIPAVNSRARPRRRSEPPCAGCGALAAVARRAVRRYDAAPG